MKQWRCNDTGRLYYVLGQRPLSNLVPSPPPALSLAKLHHGQEYQSFGNHPVTNTPPPQPLCIRKLKPPRCNFVLENLQRGVQISYANFHSHESVKSSRFLGRGRTQGQPLTKSIFRRCPTASAGSLNRPSKNSLSPSLPARTLIHRGKSRSTR